MASSLSVVDDIIESTLEVIDIISQMLSRVQTMWFTTKSLYIRQITELHAIISQTRYHIEHLSTTKEKLITMFFVLSKFDLFFCNHPRFVLKARPKATQKDKEEVKELNAKFNIKKDFLSKHRLNLALIVLKKQKKYALI